MSHVTQGEIKVKSGSTSRDQSSSSRTSLNDSQELSATQTHLTGIAISSTPGNVIRTPPTLPIKHGVPPTTPLASSLPAGSSTQSKANGDSDTISEANAFDTAAAEASCGTSEFSTGDTNHVLGDNLSNDNDNDEGDDDCEDMPPSTVQTPKKIALSQPTELAKPLLASFPSGGGITIAPLQPSVIPQSDDKVANFQLNVQDSPATEIMGSQPSKSAHELQINVKLPESPVSLPSSRRPSGTPSTPRSTASDSSRDQNTLGGVVWQPDDASNVCSSCRNEFGLFYRRHHCRLCGLLVCGTCAPYRPVPSVLVQLGIGTSEDDNLPIPKSQAALSDKNTPLTANGITSTSVYTATGINEVIETRVCLTCNSRVERRKRITAQFKRVEQSKAATELTAKSTPQEAAQRKIPPLGITDANVGPIIRSKPLQPPTQEPVAVNLVPNKPPEETKRRLVTTALMLENSTRAAYIENTFLIPIIVRPQKFIPQLPTRRGPEDERQINEQRAHFSALQQTFQNIIARYAERFRGLHDLVVKKERDIEAANFASISRQSDAIKERMSLARKLAERLESQLAAAGIIIKRLADVEDEDPLAALAEGGASDIDTELGRAYKKTLQALDTLTRTKGALDLHKYFPEYNGERWKLRLCAAPGLCLGAQDIILERIRGHFNLFIGSRPVANPSPGLPSHEAVVQVELSDVVTALAIYNFKVSGNKTATVLGALLSPSKLFLDVDLSKFHCDIVYRPPVNIPIYNPTYSSRKSQFGSSIEAVNEATRSITNAVNDCKRAAARAASNVTSPDSLGYWEVDSKTWRFDVQIKKRITGAATVPDRLVNWIIRSLIPGTIAKVVRTMFPPLFGPLLLCNQSFKVALDGSFDFSGELNNHIWTSKLNDSTFIYNVKPQATSSPSPSFTPNTPASTISTPLFTPPNLSAPESPAAAGANNQRFSSNNNSDPNSKDDSEEKDGQQFLVKQAPSPSISQAMTNESDIFRPNELFRNFPKCPEPYSSPPNPYFHATPLSHNRSVSASSPSYLESGPPGYPSFAGRWFLNSNYSGRLASCSTGFASLAATSLMNSIGTRVKLPTPPPPPDPAEAVTKTPLPFTLGRFQLLANLIEKMRLPDRTPSAASSLAFGGSTEDFQKGELSIQTLWLYYLRYSVAAKRVAVYCEESQVPFARQFTALEGEPIKQAELLTQGVNTVGDTDWMNDLEKDESVLTERKPHPRGVRERDDNLWDQILATWEGLNEELLSESYGYHHAWQHRILLEISSRRASTQAGTQASTHKVEGKLFPYSPNEFRSSPWIRDLFSSIKELGQLPLNINTEVGSMHITIPIRSTVNWLLSAVDQGLFRSDQAKRVAAYNRNRDLVKRIERGTVTRLPGLGSSATAALAGKTSDSRNLSSPVSLSKESLLLAARAQFQNRLSQLYMASAKRSNAHMQFLHVLLSVMERVLASVQRVHIETNTEVSGGTGPILELERLLRARDRASYRSVCKKILYEERQLERLKIRAQRLSRKAIRKNDQGDSDEKVNDGVIVDGNELEVRVNLDTKQAETDEEDDESEEEDFHIKSADDEQEDNEDREVARRFSSAPHGLLSSFGTGLVGHSTATPTTTVLRLFNRHDALLRSTLRNLSIVASIPALKSLHIMNTHTSKDFDFMTDELCVSVWPTDSVDFALGSSAFGDLPSNSSNERTTSQPGLVVDIAFSDPEVRELIYSYRILLADFQVSICPKVIHKALPLMEEKVEVTSELPPPSTLLGPAASRAAQKLLAHRMGQKQNFNEDPSITADMSNESMNLRPDFQLTLGLAEISGSFFPLLRIDRLLAMYKNYYEGSEPPRNLLKLRGQRKQKTMSTKHSVKGKRKTKKLSEPAQAQNQASSIPMVEDFIRDLVVVTDEGSPTNGMVNDVKGKYQNAIDPEGDSSSHSDGDLNNESDFSEDIESDLDVADFDEEAGLEGPSSNDNVVEMKEELMLHRQKLRRARAEMQAERQAKIASAMFNNLASEFELKTLQKKLKKISKEFDKRQARNEKMLSQSNPQFMDQRALSVKDGFSQSLIANEKISLIPMDETNPVWQAQQHLLKVIMGYIFSPERRLMLKSNITIDITNTGDPLVNSLVASSASSTVNVFTCLSAHTNANLRKPDPPQYHFYPSPSLSPSGLPTLEGIQIPPKRPEDVATPLWRPIWAYPWLDVTPRNEVYLNVLHHSKSDTGSACAPNTGNMPREGLTPSAEMVSNSNNSILVKRAFDSPREGQESKDATSDTFPQSGSDRSLCVSFSIRLSLAQVVQDIQSLGSLAVLMSRLIQHSE